jgi:putative inorganic carbon (HCO3(-)) transporter
VLTQSRSGWLGGAAGLLALAVLWGISGERRWQRWAALALLLGVVAGVAVLLLGWGPGQLGRLLDGVGGGSLDTAVGRVTMSNRLEIWSRALYAIQDFPFTGCGLGTFRRVVWILYPLFAFSPGQDIAHAHNVFLQMAVDIGLPGLVAYLALLGLAGAVGWQVARQGGEKRWLALGLCSGLLGYHLYGLTDALALGSRPHFLFWWMLGLLAMLTGEAEA